MYASAFALSVNTKPVGVSPPSYSSKTIQHFISHPPSLIELVHLARDLRGGVLGALAHEVLIVPVVACDEGNGGVYQPELLLKLMCTDVLDLHGCCSLVVLQ